MSTGGGCGCGAEDPPGLGAPPGWTWVLAGLAGLAVAGAVALLVAGSEGRVVGAALGVAAVAGGSAFVAWSHHLSPGEPAVEERRQGGPRFARRRLILGAGVGAAALAGAIAAVPVARRVSDATRALRTTAWRDGARAVDEEGELIRATDITEGSFITAFPEDALDDIDSQAVFIRVTPDRLVADPSRAGWAPEGLIAYSKLCTHMACPVALYQQQSGTLLCPCHQALFDVLDGGRPLQGPATRALPQLPIRVDADGLIVARGDFSDAVGAGFWGRP